MATVKEAIENALQALAVSGFPPGGDVYDDLSAALQTTENLKNEVLNHLYTKQDIDRVREMVWGALA